MSMLTMKMGKKTALPFKIRKAIHAYTDVHPLLSTEATGVCIPTANILMFLTAVYTIKSPQTME
jgi:hypothetical protein